MEEQNTKESSVGETTHAPPVEKIAAGGVRLARWANKGPNGGTYYTVTLERVFRRADGEWGSTQALRLQDIPRAILVLGKAYENALLSAGTPNDQDEVTE